MIDNVKSISLAAEKFLPPRGSRFPIGKDCLNRCSHQWYLCMPCKYMYRCGDGHVPPDQGPMSLDKNFSIVGPRGSEACISLFTQGDDELDGRLTYVVM